MGPTRVAALLLLARVFADDFDCGSLAYQRCDTRLSGNKDGFRCETTENNTCLSEERWCTVKGDFSESENCANFENVMMGACMWMEVTLGGVEYIVHTAKTEWNVAEQFCQSKGYHLVSFPNQEEYDKVLGFVEKIGRKPRGVSKLAGVKLHDALAHRCDRERHSMMEAYWMGTYYDASLGRWRNSDGTPVNQTVSCLLGPLEKFIGAREADENERYVAFLDKNYEFELLGDNFHSRKVSSSLSRARTVCKKPKKPLIWANGLAKENAGCLTGFKCGGAEPSCIVGSMFRESDVCNGVADCPLREDESTRYCEPFPAKFPDGVRTALFFPFRRSPAVAAEFCEMQNMSLPSLHSDEDVKFLMSLPRLYLEDHQAKHSEKPDFRLVAQDWRNLEWLILVGVTRDSESWSDGSKIVYKFPQIRQLPSDSEVYIDSKDGSMRAIYEQREDIYIVCQKHKYVPEPGIPEQRVGSSGGRNIPLYITLLLLLIIS